MRTANSHSDSGSGGVTTQNFHSISSTPRNNACCGPRFAEHIPKVIHKCFWLFVRSEVSTDLVLGLEHDLSLRTQQTVPTPTIRHQSHHSQRKSVETHAFGNWTFSFGKKDRPIGTVVFGKLSTSPESVSS